MPTILALTLAAGVLLGTASVFAADSLETLARRFRSPTLPPVAPEP